MTPVEWAAIYAALGAVAAGGEQAIGSSVASARDAKEKKRKTKTDALTAAHERVHDASKDLRANQMNISTAKAKNLQDMAANIRASLVK